MASDADIAQLAAVIYGEGASTGEDVMSMIGSTVLNRLESGRVKEFGGTLEEVINYPNAYYAAQDENVPYKEALAGKFPNETAENAYKRAYATASGLYKGTIDRHKAMFFFTPPEETKLRKKGRKVFDFKQVKEQGVVGDYNTYSY